MSCKAGFSRLQRNPRIESLYLTLSSLRTRLPEQFPVAPDVADAPDRTGTLRDLGRPQLSPAVRPIRRCRGRPIRCVADLVRRGVNGLDLPAGSAHSSAPRSGTRSVTGLPDYLRGATWTHRGTAEGPCGSAPGRTGGDPEGECTNRSASATRSTATLLLDSPGMIQPTPPAILDRRPSGVRMRSTRHRRRRIRRHPPRHPPPRIR